MKKAMVFTLILLVFTIAALIGMLAMILQSSTKVSVLGDVGAKGVANTDANQRADNAVLFIKRAAMQAVIQTLQDLHSNTKTEEESLANPFCGRHQEIPIWYNTSPCTPSQAQILTGMQKGILRRLSEKLQLGPQEAIALTTQYDLTLVAEGKSLRVIGTALQPTILLVSVPGANENARAIATVAADTSFDIVLPYNAQEVIDTAKNIEIIKSCSDDACLKKISPTLKLRPESTNEVKLYEFAPKIDLKMQNLQLRPLRFAIIENN